MTFLTRLLWKPGLFAGLAILLAVPAASQDAQTPEGPVAQEQVAPGEAAASETASAPGASDPELAQRVADLEAYIANTAPSKVLGPGPGHNAFIMVCAALVLFMTLPGLALFYGGLVRTKNVLSVLAQCLGCAGLVTLLWWAVGYSLAFSEGNAFVGGLSSAFLKGVGAEPGGGIWISHSVFSMFQLMFAIITPALIVGAIAERMTFKAIMLFLFGWMLVVYFPLAHMVWGPGGFMNGLGNADAVIKSIDFAGGTVVHMSSGWSALALCIILGRRTGFGQKNFLPHSLVFTLVGTGMLWVGWYGFNAGSALAADGIAANAFMTTTLAAAVAGAAWAAIEWITRGKPTVLGFCSGIVGGLVVITPAAGFVTANGAVTLGILAGVVPYFAVAYLKKWLKYDDALDTFGIHGVGGTLGAILTGVFASADANGALAGFAPYAGGTLWLEQVKSVLFTLVLSVVATVILAYIVKALVGLRPSHDVELQGLDYAEHGESGYHYAED